jgi:hypothetical protein
MAKKENKTKSFILRIDSDTMDAIEKWAADEFRSTNGQLQWIISEALRKNRRLPKKRPSPAPDEAWAAAGQAPETEKEE